MSVFAATASRGLIILDSVPGGSAFRRRGGAAIDVAGSQMSFADRALRAVIKSLNNPSPVGGGTAGPRSGRSSFPRHPI